MGLKRHLGIQRAAKFVRGKRQLMHQAKRYRALISFRTFEKIILLFKIVRLYWGLFINALVEINVRREYVDDRHMAHILGHVLCTLRRRRHGYKHAIAPFQWGR